MVKLIEKSQVAPAAEAARKIAELCDELRKVRANVLYPAKLYDTADSLDAAIVKVQTVGSELDQAARNTYVAARRGEI